MFIRGYCRIKVVYNIWSKSSFEVHKTGLNWWDGRLFSTGISNRNKPSGPTEWGYTSENGPHTWSSIAPAANGKRQSPIDIQPTACTFDARLNERPLKWQYAPVHAQTLTNNGHSAQVNYDSTASSLEGGPLSDAYKIAQLHLHWGQTSDTGSEHRVNGKMAAAELHIVHWNSNKYSSLAQAADKSDGLCVLGIFLQTGASTDHKGLKTMTDLLTQVRYKGDTIPFPGGFDPTSLFPEDSTQYWTYPGSLTTPPLYESVTWILFKAPITVSESQLTALRDLERGAKGQDSTHNEFRGKMCENYRPPQPLEGRVVSASFQ